MTDKEDHKRTAFTKDRAFDARPMQQAVVHAFDDYTRVTLVRAVDVQGVAMPAGAQGVIMSTWEAGPAYEVEFESPQHAVLTIEEVDLRA